MYWSKLILILLASITFADSIDDLRLNAMLNENNNAKLSSESYLKLYDETKLKAYLENGIKQGFIANLNMDKAVNTLRDIDKDNNLIKKLDIVKLVEQKNYKQAKKEYYKFISKNEDFTLANAMSKELFNQGLKKEALQISKDYYKKYSNLYSLYLYIEMLMANEKYKDVVKLTEEFNKTAEENNKVDTELAPFLLMRLNALKALNMWEKTIRLDPKGYSEQILKLFKEKDYKNIKEYTKLVPINPDYSLFLLYRLEALYELNNSSDINEIFSLGMKLYEFTNNKDILYTITKKLLEFNKKKELYEIANLDDELAYKVYFNLKEYKKLSEFLYQKAIKENNNSYLIESYIYEMLDNPKEFDYFKLDELVAKGGVAPNMLNIYAYTIIDEKIDIVKGIKLIQKALEQEPDNAYFLDTLAWGYYLINDCKNAQETMQKVLQNEDVLNEDEIKLHNQRINKCKN
ncbi:MULTISPECIES: hypothetical protein [unclassified Campylobacter]|uniref:hypothetical protein n=1 Tax=unclassified Campylobacter TaxID=2593542 RepID=UPI001D4FF6FD|nr:hypothetical protein [Campylobacter sp. RM9331]MBZ8005048.1 hypothetical protein [Campylobacter sp. RM9332]